MSADHPSHLTRVVLVVVVIACSSGDSNRQTLKRPPPNAAVVVAASASPGLRLPAGVTPLAYDLRLELDPDRETFAGRVIVRVKLDKPTTQIWLHADEVVIGKAQFRAGTKGGFATVSPQTEHEMHAIGLPEAVGGEVVLELDYTGRVGDDVEGLFRQKFAGKWFLYSQAEATYARRIVPCFDEPQFKVPWRVTLVVPGGQVALANAPVAAERVLADKRQEITFAEMPALPPHLFAVAVGPFTLVDLGVVGKQRVPVRAAVAPKDAKRLGSASTWLPKLVDALEQYFDQPLPLVKLDLVAVPRFFGAMENPGLITFEVTALVGNDKDPSFLRRHIRFLAHELAHQWVGNAVTPRWWDDLWLAEAFATWLDDKLSNAIGKLDDPALRTQLARAHALEADRELAAKPLRRTIVTNDDIEDAFDAISYEKGAAVIAMFEQFIGEEKFRDIMRAYVARPGTATAQELLAQLARVDATLSKAFAGYLDRPGAPIVDLALDCSSTPQVTASPRDGAVVPVCVRHPAGKACALASGPTTINLASCPAWLVGNADGRGYYYVQWRGAPPITQLAPAERLAHGQDRAAAIARGEVAKRDALVEIDALLAARDPYAELAAIAMVGELDRTIAEADAPAWARDLGKRFPKRLTRTAIWRPSSSLEFAVREALVELVSPDQFAADARKEARTLLDVVIKKGMMAIRSSELVIAVALAAPEGGKPLYEHVVASAAKNTAFADEWFEGLAYFDASFASRAVELALDKRFEADRAWAAIGGMFARTATRGAAWRAVQARLGEVLAMLGRDATLVIDATAGLCERQHRIEVEAALSPHVGKIAGGKRALEQALAAIDRCVRASGAPTSSPAP